MNTPLVSINKNIPGGTPCFAGTRVPVASLFDHLAGGYTIDYFLSQFPSVTREQATELLNTLGPTTDRKPERFKDLLSELEAGDEPSEKSLPANFSREDIYFDHD